ncbi:unnamed protein product [Sordaria macrospora k-hell]|uniref:WGS project CABT00000000 data, contig 2.10 n=1 Tax=Sordaria macrospora (strain ATCC MYA-333 / DSM 997 / K(L3346) / K-hell) TaxID=771870 RepID=F7VWN6_SORMK|nr:uncharacterized protein SMAC_03360 [Sordaria macrospora k-hell]CCC09804.1 unnamed protein product [Sordaria macrospora k-hell]
MGDIEDSDLIKAQLAMDALGATRVARSKTQAPPKPPTTETDPATEALDTSAYKIWKDEATGKLLPTCGALLPPGYEQSDQPDLPWICPIRTCRALLPGLTGLGRHFGVVHRACRLNDNLDGTLTDLGTYADPTPGNGRRFGGIPRSCIMVSKKYMSLAESPMVEPKPYTYHAQNNNKAAQELPKRELRRRSQIDGSGIGTIQVPAMSDDELNPQDEVKGAIIPSSEGPAEKILVNSKSGRPYNMWPDESGELKDLMGTVLPDKWTFYTEHPTHQWICPVRSCRWLYSARSHLANHFKMRYYGCRFNDNLDGTFTIVKRPASLPLEQLRIDFGNNPPAVISRGPDNTEPLAEPQMSQNYINRKLREHRRGKSSSVAETIIKDGRDLQKRHNAERTNSPAENARVIASNVGFKHATDGRPYTHLLNPETNQYQVTRGLIPEGYQLEHEAHPIRPWICPIRSCRLLSRTQAAYSNHWNVYHPNVCVNDNQDGTFSIVEGLSENGARVVSRGPMGYDESPSREAQLPIKERGRVVKPDVSTDDGSDQQTKALGQVRQKRSFNKISTTPPGPEPEEEQAGDPEGLWRYIISQTGGDFPDIEEPELEILLALPRRRDLKLKRPIPVTHTLTFKQLASIAVQLTGREMPSRLSKLVSSSCCNACANCLYDKTHNACSIKHMTKFKEKRVADVVAFSGDGDEARDEAGHDAEDEADEEDDEEETYEYDEQLGATVIRRSKRLPSLPHAEENEADMDAELPPPRKVITFKDPSPTYASVDAAGAEEEQEDAEYRRASKRLRTREQSAITTSIQATATAARSLLTSEEDLVTEDWERGSRGVLPKRSQPSEDLVYSSSYLSTNQNVQIGKSTTLTTLIITSGSTHQLPLDRSRTQICTLVSGKLRVTINNGEEEFVVGPRGVFKVSPGATCLLENWCYMDAAVHVTAVADQ